MAAAMRQTPQSYTLLHVQCDFLRSKGQNQWALKLARQAVNCAPSEFVTWEKLADIYIDLMQYDSVWLSHTLSPSTFWIFIFVYRHFWHLTHVRCLHSTAVMPIVFFQPPKSTSLFIGRLETSYQRDTKQKTMMYGPITIWYFCRETDFNSVNQRCSACLLLVFGELGQEHMLCWHG